MKISHHAVSLQGTGRSRNEDSILIDETCQVFAVADGVGGLAAGDLASGTAVQSIEERIVSDGCEVMDEVATVVEDAHLAVATAGREVVGETIATTLTLAHFDFEKTCVRVAHVGDSFALILRGKTPLLLTEEHTWERSLRNLMDLAPYSDDYRHSLTQALGADAPLQIDVASSGIHQGDRVLIATDGISSVLPVSEIIRELSQALTPEEGVRSLCHEAKAAGSTDDISVIVIFVEKD